jgi:hypothetical protein
MTTQKYLFFNELTQEWEETTLDELATLDNEAALVCPLKEDGTPGAQTTYGALLKAAVPKTLPKKKAPAPAPAPAPVPAAPPAPPAPEEKHQPVMLSKELENTIFFTCRVFNMFALASYYGAALLFCQYEKSIGALIIAVFLHFVVYAVYLNQKVR